MLISGLQKLTLLDYPGKMACTVFTGGCDFRCPFCHNASLVRNPEDFPKINEDEFFDFLEKRKNILEGVCITGGEPTIQKGLKEFIIRIREKGYLIKLDTNGNHPEILKELVNEGLVDYVAMDIKNSIEKYPITVDVKNFNIKNIKESVDFLLSDIVDYEFRTTVVKELHNEDDIVSIAKWIKGAKRYFLQGFVDSGDLICDGYSGYDKKEMESLLEVTKKYIVNTELRGY